MKKQTTTSKWLAVFSALIIMSSSTLAQNSFTVAGVAESSRSQDISKLPKMERDIIILQNVLDDLFNGGENRLFSSSGGAKGIYIPGKGVIFNIGGGNSSLIMARFLATEQTHAQAKKENEKSNEQKNTEIEARNKAVSKDFLVNYGSILSDLKSGEQVMLNVNYSELKDLDSKEESGLTISGAPSIIYRGGLNQKRMISSIDYSTIDSYLSGKTTLESAQSKISQSIIDKSANSSQDAKIMAGILDDLFQSNFDGIYRRSGKTSWTYFEGFGLMYDLNLSARGGAVWSSGNLTVVGSRVTATTQEADAAQEEATKEVEEKYDDLIELVKESLITYGRTLRSVKSDEVVILNINFGSAFRKTKVPKAVRLQVTKSQIEAYSKGQKSLEQLKKEINITKLSTSTSFGIGSQFGNFPEAVIYGNAPEDVNQPLKVVGKTKSAKKPN